MIKNEYSVCTTAAVPSVQKMANGNKETFQGSDYKGRLVKRYYVKC